MIARSREGPGKVWVARSGLSCQNVEYRWGNVALPGKPSGGYETESDSRSSISLDFTLAHPTSGKDPILNSPRTLKKRLFVAFRRTGFRVRLEIILGAAICALVLACSEHENGDATPNTTPPNTAATLTPHPTTTQAGSSPTASSESAFDTQESAAGPLADPEAPPFHTPPLDDLLRLPESVTRPHADLALPTADPEELTEKKREEARLRIEFQRQKEADELDPDGSRTRERADAGVSVDVDGDTRLRGGVQVEKEADEDWHDPVPTVGIEGRF
jgi:hypothetical protein